MSRAHPVLNLRVLIWTFGLGFVGYALASKGSYSYFDSTIMLGILAGAGVGFALGTLLSRITNRKRF